MAFDQPWQLAMFDKTLKNKMRVALIKRHLGELSGARALMISCGDNNRNGGEMRRARTLAGDRLGLAELRCWRRRSRATEDDGVEG